jgi:acyl-CoA synthetase (AMP-forming)/AMP-acid ligase II/acyl carrier protein
MPLSYGGLLRQVEDTVRALNDLGVGRNDRVAIALPNGPEMAAAFLGVAAGATAAPLNPAYRAREFDFYLSDLNAKALLVQAGIDSPARGVARARGIPLFELSPVAEAEAGIFTLTTGDEQLSPTHDGFAHPEDIALVLHTSGTTARPKIVPLTQANICASAHYNQAALELTGSDCCLSVTPLFHVNGLLRSTLSSLGAGGSVFCSPGFYAPRFFEWMEEARPTWYTAVPTMHQAILARAALNREIIARRPLRFIRTGAAPCPPWVMAELESVFDCPVIEGYGMTEATPITTSNLLSRRKPGSVGPAAGPEVAIMDEAGLLLSPGQSGEIVVRGDNVTPGYEGNPQANASAFTNGWLRTGDQGYLDDEGYLFVTGRIKEIINRGGEKISPREVDEALLKHPAVAQAVAFAVPHERLGEDVAAAVVLRPDAAATERELQKFTATRLADFKVPRRVVLLDEIPKGPTGKVQRIGLADKLGLIAAGNAPPQVRTDFVAPRTPVEETLAEIWIQVLGVERVGIHDNFFELGGDSLRATQVISRVQEAFQVELTHPSFFEAPTVADLAVVIAPGQTERDKMAIALADLENLSDEEAERLLAEAKQAEGME